MVTDADVITFLGVPAGTAVSSLLDTATALIAREIGDAVVPEDVLDNVTLQLCGELKMRADNPGGVMAFAGADMVTRLSKDPMTSIRPILSRWVVPF